MTSQAARKGEVANAPQAALYIAALADELARLAKSHGLEALAYILDMARLEADQISKLSEHADHQFAGAALRRSTQGARTPTRLRKVRPG